MKPQENREIIAISNGMAASQHALGEYIDGFSEVVRFNAAVVSSDYAPFIGTKTTIWSCSDWTSVDDPRGYTQAHRQFAHCKQLMAIPDIPCKEDVKAPVGFELIPPVFERKIRLEVDPHPECWLTTGTITIAWLLRTYQVIHALGWFSPAHEFYLHYYADPLLKVPKLEHDIDAERRWIKLQVKKGCLIEVTG